MLFSALIACATEAAVELAPDPGVEPAAEAGLEVEHVHDSNCTTGCSTGDAKIDEHLTNEEIAVYLEDWGQTPVGEDNLDLDTLLFYFHDTERALDELDTVPLDEAHRAWLEEQIARSTATVEMRLIDEDGVERGHMGPVDIPMKIKQHLIFEGTGSLAHLETGGKVKRVGLGHLWSRW